jgi:hypothetical protein
MNRSPCLCDCGDHAFAPLTRGFVTLVSPEDSVLLNRPWCVTICRYGSVYAVRSGYGSHKSRERLHLHKEILGDQSAVGDHINGNSLDNRRPNLRSASLAQNSCNRKRKGNSTSKFKGVSKGGGRFKWRVYLAHAKRNNYIGTFTTEEEAARAYDAMAVKLHGEFARPNFPIDKLGGWK